MSAPRHWLAVVNPVAGNGAGRRVARTLARTFADAGVRVDLLLTPGPDEAARLARQAADDGYEVVVAVGGDGTANECANGLVGTSVPLAMYPVGTGNDFARNLGYPRRRRDLARFLAAARRRVIDAGEANGRLFVNHVGVGIDGVVAETARHYARYVGPLLGYALSSVVAIARYRPVPMHVSIDDAAEDGRYLIVLTSNGPRFGSGMKPAPRAEMDDGWFDVTLAGDLGVGGSIATLVRLYRGAHVDGTRVRSRRARRLDITLERSLPMELDGEPSRVSTLAIRMRERCLTVLAR